MRICYTSEPNKLVTQMNGGSARKLIVQAKRDGESDDALPALRHEQLLLYKTSMTILCSSS